MSAKIVIQISIAVRLIMTNIKVQSPLDKGKKIIDEIFEIYKKQLIALTFISTFSLKKTDEYSLPNQNKFLFQMWNKTFMVETSKTKITVSLKANFVVLDVKECFEIHNNNKTAVKPSKYYLISLKNHKGKIEKGVEIANNSKSDYKQFQSDINSRYNDFAINMTESEFKTFVAEYISPKVASIAYIYTNAGVLEHGKFLYENALVDKDKILWANDDGYIETEKDTYMKLAEASHCLPKLAKSIKTGKQVAHELIVNIQECWNDNIILPLLTLGHMVMAIYFEDFVKHYGVPTLLLFGDSGTGKSTLVNVGLALFGLSKEAMTAGGSTAKSTEYFSATSKLTI